MPSTTPPKGRPTPGRRDRTVATRRHRSRASTKRFVWAVIALAVVAAVIIVGSASGTNAPTPQVVAPLLLLRSTRLAWPAARS